jgi:hypothetical protein
MNMVLQRSLTPTNKEKCCQIHPRMDGWMNSPLRMTISYYHRKNLSSNGKTLLLLGFEPEIFGFQVGTATN